MIIFPNVVIEPDSTIGNGCVICANSVINRDAFIADYSFVNSSSVDRPTVLVEMKIEEFSSIEDGKVVI